jgi:hypothetical protein
VNQPDTAAIFKSLRAVRRSLMMSNFFRWSARWTIIFLCAFVAVFAWKWVAGDLRMRAEWLPALAMFVLLPSFGAGILAAIAMTLFRPPSIAAAARAADCFFKTRDRFVSGLEFAGRTSPSEFERLAISECAAFARGNRCVVPVAVPQELRWAVVPMVMIALISWDAIRSDAVREEMIAQATLETGGTAKSLDALAEKIAKKDGASEEARKLAEELRKAAEQLRAEAREGRDGAKAALRELSRLEELVKEMRRGYAATPEEIGALASALAGHDKTKDAAADMQRGDFGEAARKLDETAADPESAEQIAKRLEQAMEHLAQQKEQLSKQLENLRENARASGASGERSELLKQLARTLDELQKQGKAGVAKDGKAANGSQRQPGQPAGREMTDDDLKRMLGALQNLKNSDGPPDGEGEPQPGGDEPGDGEIRISNFGGKNPGGTQPGTDEHGEQFPTGQPGDGKDEKGTTKDPFGKEGAVAKTGKESEISGRLAAGESLSTMIPSAAGADEKSKRRYRELYNAASAEAEDSVVQESIPLGARLLIKRYFDSIKPRE